MVLPIAPKFRAAGPPKLKNGACKIPAGNSFIKEAKKERERINKLKKKKIEQTYGLYFDQNNCMHSQWPDRKDC